MNLSEAKYVAIAVLFMSNVIMALIGICLQRCLMHYSGNTLSIVQNIISCLTSGILLGTLLMIILPTAVEYMGHRWHIMNIGYLLVGLGFFLICILEEMMSLYESYIYKKNVKTEQEKLINSPATTSHHHRVTHLVTLVVALGTHYFFNGILIGGQTKDVSKLWLLLGVICFHMSLIAFSVTLRLLMDNVSYARVILTTCLWSAMGSLGVLISLLISSGSSGLTLVNGILQCLSAGTFIYITFIDMIHNELTQTKLYPLVNICVIFGGFLIIVLASLFHDHSQ